MAKAGFATKVRTGIVPTAGREEVVDTPLSVATTTQAVVVTGGAPFVESTTASLGSLVDDQTNTRVPQGLC